MYLDQATSGNVTVLVEEQADAEDWTWVATDSDAVSANPKETLILVALIAPTLISLNFYSTSLKCLQTYSKGRGSVSVDGMFCSLLRVDVPGEARRLVPVQGRR